jgi:hypothetical protein
MPFEAFLADSRTRPKRLRIFGYAFSLAVHGPPVTAFCISWLTTTMLVGGTFDFELGETEAGVVYYQVPVALLHTFPGYGTDTGTGGGVPTAGGNGLERRGASGPPKRRTRRPLTVPHERSRFKVVALDAAEIGPEHQGNDPEDTFGGQQGAGKGAGDGDGFRGGEGQSGPGGVGSGPGGRGLLAAATPTKASHPSRKAASRGKTYKDEDTGAEFQGDDETVVGAPLPGRPSTRVSMEYGAYLRIAESFPGSPDSCWPPGRLDNSLLVEVCVSETGDVSDVTVRESACHDADSTLTSAMRNWRYRPLRLKGMPRAFCHPIKVVYKKETRFDRRF